jgi:CubicO group peptidase (beta-lactamase class C family)
MRSMVCYPDGVALEGFTTTARDLARFGLCLLRGGDGLAIDSGYLRESMTPSTPLNPAYGYLWWLNGQPWQLAPKQPDPIDGWLIPDAPADLVAALGDLARALYIVPSLDLVVVRLGVVRGPAPAGRLQFGRGLWARLRAAGPASDG